MEVSALIHTLHEAGKRLEVLTRGEVDAVADASGHTFLLRSAQVQLRYLEAAKQAAVLNALPANIAMIDAQGVVVSVNDAWRSFGDHNSLHAAGHAVGLNYLETCDSASGEFSAEAHAAAQGIRDVLSGARDSAHLEYPCHSPTEQRWFLLSVTPLAEDRASGAVVMHVDITARVLAAEALERQRVELRALVDLMPAMIWFKDTHNRILRVNQQVAAAAGKSLAEIEGKPSAEIYPENAARFYADDLEVIQSGQSKLAIVEPLQFPDGSMHWVQTDKVPFFDPSGQVAGIVVMTRDVTAQKQADAAFELSQKHLRDIFDGLGPSMFVALLEPDGTLIEVNKAPLIAAGLKAEDVLGLPFDQTHWWKSSSAAQQQLREAIARAANGEASRYDVRTLGADGEYIDVDFSLQPLRDAAGKVVFLVPSASVITERTRTEAALRASDRELRESARLLTIERSHLLEAQRLAKVGDWTMDLQGEGMLWSEELYRIHEVDALVFVTTRASCLELVHPEDRDKLAQDVRDSIVRGGPCVTEHRILLPGNRIKVLEERWQVTLDNAGVPLRATGTCQDVTERKQAETLLRRMNRVYEVLSQINALIVRVKSRDELFTGVCRIAVDAGFLLAWVGTCDMQARTIEPVAWSGRGEDYLDHIPLDLDDEMSVPARVVRGNQVVVLNDMCAIPYSRLKEEALKRGFKSMIMVPLTLADECVGLLALYAGEMDYFRDDETKLLLGLASNISFALDYVGKEERLNYLAYFDSLTGLANQTLFLQRLKTCIAAASLRRAPLAVFVLDIQRFKSINDAFGRKAGDELLQQVSVRIVGPGGDASRFARIGADRFAIFADAVGTEPEVGRYVEQRMEAAFGRSFRVQDHDVRVSVTVGIALFPQHGPDAETLIRHAEAAAKKAKMGGDRYLFFTPAMTARVAERLSLEQRLREALERDQFVLHYQPKVLLDGGQVAGAEALIRWNDPRTGLVPPMQFIPILEETGLIHEVGRWALRTALVDYLRWRQAGLRAVRVAVNVSPLQLRNRTFGAEIEQVLSVSPFASEGLELEITESLIMEDVGRNIDVLNSIRDLGVSIAIDDFGTGFSSLSYLSKLPVDSLKIDRSFINDMTSGSGGLSLVSTIIQLAQSLKLKVVAEGVETEEQARFLRLLRCNEMQGYLVSRPVPADAFAAAFLSPLVGSEAR